MGDDVPSYVPAGMRLGDQLDRCQRDLADVKGALDRVTRECLHWREIARYLEVEFERTNGRRLVMAVKAHRPDLFPGVQEYLDRMA